MGTKKGALAQAKRLAVLRYFQVDTLADLAKTIYECSASDQAAVRLTDWLIANCEDVPTPRAIREAQGALMDRDREANTPRIPAAPNCSRCFGSGWEIVFRLHTREGIGESSFVRKETLTREQFESFSGGKLDQRVQMVYSGARKCGCGSNQPGQAA